MPHPALPTCVLSLRSMCPSTAQTLAAASSWPAEGAAPVSPLPGADTRQFSPGQALEAQRGHGIRVTNHGFAVAHRTM